MQRCKDARLLYKDVRATVQGCKATTKMASYYVKMRRDENADDIDMNTMTGMKHRFKCKSRKEGRKASQAPNQGRFGSYFMPMNKLNIAGKLGVPNPVTGSHPVPA